MILRVGFQVFEFSEGRDLRFGSTDDALSWLKRLGLPDSDLMTRMRELLRDHAGDPDSARLTDHQVLERLAGLLSSRRIIVIGREQRTSSGQPAEKAESSAPAFPLSERATAAPASAPPPPTEPSTFDPNVDAAAQASALVAAAADGKPFCPE
jgi:hypothetical protein